MKNGSINISGLSKEEVQDAVGGILTDSASVDFTYDDASNTISATVLTPGITAPGSDTQVVFNDGGALGADAGLVYNKTTDALTAGSFSGIGTALSALNASNLSSGTVALARGGTGADLSATGGANQFVRQSTLGGVFTVSSILDADIPDTITIANLTQITTRNHNDLASLQGGTTSEYYHLTSAEYTGTGTGVFARKDAPTFTGTVSATTFSGSGASLTAVPAGQLTGTITSGVQDNITRLGTLTAGPTGFTAGSIVFHNGTTLAQDNTKLFWDDSNNTLGIGTATPSAVSRLHIIGADTNTIIYMGSASDAIGVSFNWSYDNSRYTIGSSHVGAQLWFETGDGVQTMCMTDSKNVGIGTTTFGTSAANVIAIANGTAPSSSPASLGQLYVESGALKYRGSSGTVTTLGVA